MVATSLSFCLFAQILHQNLHANEEEVDECAGALSIALPSVLEGFDGSGIRISDKDKKQLFAGTENVIINEITNESIGHPEFTGPGYERYTISFFVDGQVKSIGLSIQKKDNYPYLNSLAGELVAVLRKVPRNLLGRVNKIAILLATPEVELEKYNALFSAMFFRGHPLGREEQKKVSRMGIVKLNETYHSPTADEIIIRIPLPDEADKELIEGLDHYFNVFHRFIFISIVEHQLGHIMAYHRYGGFTPDQEWHNAILADKASVSEYGDGGINNMAEDFAAAAALYLRTDRRLLHPDTEGRYTHRMKILDEIMGLNSSQRRQIEERNKEIDHLFRQLGLPKGLNEILNDMFNDMFVDRHTSYEYDTDIIVLIIRGLREELIVNPDTLIMARTLANKALILHRNRPLDFTSTDESSVRENLIRTLAFHGLSHLPTEKDTSFIKDTIHSLDTLSTSEMEHRLHVFDQVFKSRLDEGNVNSIEQALRFFNRHSFPQELDDKFYDFYDEIYLDLEYGGRTTYVILTTIDLQDTLSSSDMESYLHTLKEAANIFVEKYEEYGERLRGLDINEDKQEIDEINKDRPFFKIVGRLLEESPTGRRIKEALRRVLKEYHIEEIL